MRSPNVRLLAACALFSAWLVPLLAGWAFGGAIHLVLAAALVAFPWRAARQPLSPASEDAARSSEEAP
ncbi:MAG: hypothetical protein ACM3OB_08025 [Acidobacteriota bacterium]